MSDDIHRSLEGTQARPTLTAFKFQASETWKEALDDITDRVGALSCAEALRKIIPIYRELLEMSDDGILEVITKGGRVTRSLV